MQLYFKHYSQIPLEQWVWPNFSPAEIAVRGGPRQGAVLINPPALDALQTLRNTLGAPVILNSAYRDPEWNRIVGGAFRSKHLMGIAFDVRDSDYYSRDELVAAARSAGFCGFGYYANFIHIDLGPKRKWP